MGIYLYNSEEIKKIRNACLITANILDDIEAKIDEGISTYDIDCIAHELVRKHAVEPAFLGYEGYPAVICTSVNEVVIHGIPSKKVVLKSGDIISIDLGIKKDGYFGDSARTILIGNVSEEARKLVEVTKKSLYLGIESIKPGSRIFDISFAVQSHIEKFGYSAVRAFSGHGIGKKLHEEPSIPNFGVPGKGLRIKDGMVFAIEPMINMGTYKVRTLDDHWTVVTKDNSLSAHFEHTVAVIDGKADILTKGKFFN